MTTTLKLTAKEIDALRQAPVAEGFEQVKHHGFGG